MGAGCWFTWPFWGLVVLYVYCSGFTIAGISMFICYYWFWCFGVLSFRVLIFCLALFSKLWTLLGAVEFVGWCFLLVDVLNPLIVVGFGGFLCAWGVASQLFYMFELIL